MATATITPDQNAVLAEIFIAAPPARVFQAISDPTQLPKWWGQTGLYHVTKSTMDLRPGGKWRSDGIGADGKAFYVEGEYLEVDPPRLLVHTWIGSYSPDENGCPLGTRAPQRSRACIPAVPRSPAPGRWCACARKASPATSNPPKPRRRLEARPRLAGSLRRESCQPIRELEKRATDYTNLRGIEKHLWVPHSNVASFATLEWGF